MSDSNDNNGGTEPDEEGISIPQALQVAMQYLQQENLDQAEKFCALVLAAEPENSIALYIKGVVAKQAGDADAAIDCFKNSLKSNSEFSEAANILGVTLIEQERFDEAAFYLRIAVGKRPIYPQAHNNLGVALKGIEDLEDAAASFEMSLEQNPGDIEVLDNLGMTYCLLGRLEEAMSYLEKALAIDPNYPEALNDLGITLHDMGRYDEAIESYRKALAARPDYDEASYNLALCLLLKGAFGEGWNQYEKRFSIKKFALAGVNLLGQTFWDGSALDGKTILLFGEQGAGDSIQFIRYVERIKDMGATVVVNCAPELKTLFKTVAGIDKLISTPEALPRFDVFAPLLSLPRILGMTGIDDIPGNVPYLAATKNAIAERPVDTAKTHVGFVWAGNKDHQNDIGRSVPPEYFGPLVGRGGIGKDGAGKDGIAFYSLQVGERSAEIRGLDFYPQIRDIASKLTDYALTAAFINQLDLIITVDTSVAHLAGAMGKPVWTLLPFVPDFRWMLERTDSPWYPTMRLFRQPSPGDWDSVFADVAAALKAL
ncbi:MAG: tetratricopeptide repeat protein [Rhodospirillaceae bacterium]|nr:tetratricopeptide repeat protein [Rhodospirillaceae bacterium]